MNNLTNLYREMVPAAFIFALIEIALPVGW